MPPSDKPAPKTEPKSIRLAMAQLVAAGDTRRGWDLRNAALAKWPHLRKGLITGPGKSPRPEA